MTVRVGVIGVGMIGQDHIRRLTRVLSGVDVVAVSDVDPARTRAVAERPARRAGPPHRGGARSPTPASTRWWSAPGARRTSSTSSLRSPPASRCSARSRSPRRRRRACGSSTAETDVGRRLVQVGFMRRYDAAYRALREVVRQRIDRAAAADALHPSQPERARLLPEGVGHHRHRGARDRHGAVDVRRGDRGDHGARARARAATVASCRTRSCCSWRWPVVCSSTSRSR